MKIYNVLWQDRHTDTTATPFRDLDEAKAWARKQAVKCCQRDFHLINETDDFLYCIEYSPENDCLWITEHEI